MNKIITTISDFDPFAKLLLRFKVTPFKLGALVFLLNLIVDGFLGVKYNVFYSVTRSPGILQDISAISFDFLIQPLVCGAYLWTSIAFEQVLPILMMQNSKKEIDRKHAILKNVLERYKKYRFSLLAILFGVLFSYAQVAGYMGWVPWETISGYLYIYPPMSFARAPFWFLTFYCIAYGIFNIALTSSVIQELTKEINMIHVDMLHPDKCGGVGEIGSYAAKLGYVIAPLGLYASILSVIEIQKGTFSTTYPIHVFIFLYVLIAPAVFVSPVWYIHKAMIMKKNLLLHSLSNQYGIEYERIIIKLKQSQNYPLKKIEYIHQIYKKTEENFPTWPFNLGNIREFAAAVIGSLLPLFFSLIFDAISNMLIT